MTNPLSRMLAQAELNLADVARRSVDSVTLPIKMKSQEVIAEVSSSVIAHIRTLAIKAGLAVFAVVMLIVALVYAVSALHGYLVRVTGPVEALVIMAAIFAVLALAALIAVAAWPAPNPKSKAVVQAAAVQAKRVAEQTRVKARAMNDTIDRASEPDMDFKAGFDTIVAALGDAGLRKEQAGLKAGLALANQLRPVQLVSLALLGGFVAGLRLMGKRRAR